MAAMIFTASFWRNFILMKVHLSAKAIIFPYNSCCLNINVSAKAIGFLMASERQLALYALDDRGCAGIKGWIGGIFGGSRRCQHRQARLFVGENLVLRLRGATNFPVPLGYLLYNATVFIIITIRSRLLPLRARIFTQIFAMSYKEHFVFLSMIKKFLLASECRCWLLKLDWLWYAIMLWGTQRHRCLLGQYLYMTACLE